MAEFLKSQSPQEQWKAALKPKDPLKPEDPAVQLLDQAGQLDPSGTAQAVQAATAPGTGLLLDLTA